MQLAAPCLRRTGKSLGNTLKCSPRRKAEHLFSFISEWYIFEQFKWPGKFPATIH